MARRNLAGCLRQGDALPRRRPNRTDLKGKKLATRRMWKRDEDAGRQQGILARTRDRKEGRRRDQASGMTHLSCMTLREASPPRGSPGRIFPVPVFWAASRGPSPGSYAEYVCARPVVAGALTGSGLPGGSGAGPLQGHCLPDVRSCSITSMARLAKRSARGPRVAASAPAADPARARSAMPTKITANRKSAKAT